VSGRLLLEYTDPATWFDELFLPFNPNPRHVLRSTTPSAPPILERARKGLAPLLFVPERHYPPARQ
jgi:hypothetical protein